MKNHVLLKRAFGTILFLLFSVISMAQERQVTGIVQDEKKSPLEGATVAVKKSTSSTVTNADGKFTIKVPAGKVSLSISFVGYESATINIGENRDRFGPDSYSQLLNGSAYL